MIKTAIFQLNVNHPENYRLPMKSVANYCNKYGINHIVSDKIVVNRINFYFENLQAHILTEKFDRVLYLDADIIITPHAENIFDVYTEDDVFYAYDEANKTETMDRDKYVEDTIRVTGINWPKNEKGCYRYFNAGVIILSKKTRLIPINEIPQANEIFSFGNQTILNYQLTKLNHKFQSIDYSWNRMHLGDPDLNKERFKANFIHYAGPVLYNNYESKLKNIEEDYRELYES